MRTTEELRRDIRLLEEWRIQGYFDKEYDGSCPCFWGKKKVGNAYVFVHGTCWRVAKVGIQDLYVWGKLPKNDIKAIATEIKRKLDRQKWYNPYTIVTHNPNGRPKLSKRKAERKG